MVNTFYVKHGQIVEQKKMWPKNEKRVKRKRAGVDKGIKVEIFIQK